MIKRRKAKHLHAGCIGKPIEDKTQLSEERSDLS